MVRMGNDNICFFIVSGRKENDKYRWISDRIDHLSFLIYFIVV